MRDNHSISGGHFIAFITIFGVGMLNLPPAALAQVVIPEGTDIGAYVNGDTSGTPNWSSTSYTYSIAADATFNSSVGYTATSPTQFVLDGNGNSVTRSANFVFRFGNGTADGSSVTLANLTFGQTVGSSNSIFEINDTTTSGTVTINLSNVTFTGLNGSSESAVFEMNSGNRLSSTVNAGTGANGVRFTNNAALNNGAAVLGLWQGTMTFNGDYTFTGNSTANYGGAIIVYGVSNALTFTGTTVFNSNFANSYGGAIDLWGGASSVTFSGPTTFSGNYVLSAATGANSPRGGAINIGVANPGTGNASTVRFTGTVTFDGNRAVSTGANSSAYGGALSASANGASYDYQYLFENGSLFQNNYAAKTGTGTGGGYGGAIYINSSAALLQLGGGARFLNNYASTSGGAIYLESGKVELNADSADIEFQGNRHGVQFDDSNLPVAGTGTPNAIVLGTSGTLELNAAAGRQIRFRDPISSVSDSTAVVLKTGEGEVAFYGDNGSTTQYDSDITIDTTVESGNFTLANGAGYGSTTAGDFIVTSTAGGAAGTVRGGTNSRLRSQTITIEDKGTVAGTGGVFTLDAPTIGFEGGSRLGGTGTLAATSNVQLKGVVAGVVDAGATLEVSANLAGTGGLDVQSGTLALSGAGNSYTGTTRVGTGATLAGRSANAFAQSSAVTVDGTLDMTSNLSQTASNLTGTGTINLGSQTGTTLTANNSGATAFSGTLTGSGNLVKTGTGTLTLSGSNTHSGGTTISAGQLTATSGSAFGTGAIANSGTLNLDFATNSTLANTLSGTGSLTKTGAGTVTLSGAGTQGAVSVNAGELRFGHTGTFNASSYTTGTGSTTSMLGTGQLVVANAFTQSSGSTLNVAFGDALPLISATSAVLDGKLGVAGFSSSAPSKASELVATQFTVVSTTDGITGDFSEVDLGGAGSSLDYLYVGGLKSADGLSYSVGLDLAWTAGATLGNGVFTLNNAADRFDADVVLSDQVSSATGWDGKTLTKNGAGTLTLSAAHTYTGPTVVNGGTLAMGIANAIATTSSLTLNTGSTFALNDFNQSVNTLSGSGSIQLGSAATTRLTTVNAIDSNFAGAIHGAGGLTKTGAGVLTLSGQSDYTGGTTVEAGTLVGTVGKAFGAGGVTNNSTLRLDFAGDEVVTNALSGSGSLTKAGAGTATLTSAGTQGAVSVDLGTLAFASTGGFQADSVATKANATTAITGDAHLNVTNGFDMASNSTLDLVLGSKDSVVTAGTATVDGALYIVGFAPSGPNTASGLTGTRFTLLQTTGGITGEFTIRDFGGAASDLDYLLLDARKSSDNLSYIAGLGLTWRSGEQTGDGAFTLANASDLFNVDVVLADQAASASGWDGKTLTKNGAGTLMLSAANTYTGPTVINGGTLSMGIADGLINSREVTVAAGATLALNDYSQTANELSGAGAIALGSSGSTVLTVNNTSDRNYSGTIGGAGSLVKIGAGTLSLSGLNTYAGGTTISAGTVRGPAASFGNGNILNNAALIIDQPDGGTFGAAINGSGTFTKTGAGALNLTGNGNLSGATTIAAGLLSVNGSLANSAMVVQSGATLGGNGTVGRTAIQAGGNVAPGNSIGTLRVSGAYSQASGATYHAELATDSSASDLIQVDGTATLEPGAELAVSYAGAGSLGNPTRYTVLSSTQGLTGTFKLTGNLYSGLYKLVDVYDAFNVYLQATLARDIVDVAGTPNEKATANAIGSLPDDNALKQTVSGLESDDEIRRSLNQLSGEIHASLKSGLLNDSQLVRNTAIARIRQADCAPDVDLGIESGQPRPHAGTQDACTAGQWQPVGWVRVFGNWGSIDSNGDAAKMTQNSGGLLLGTDVTVFDTWRAGALAGYGLSNFKSGDRSSSARADSYHLGIYGGTQRDRLGIRLGSSFTWHDIDTSRSPNFGTFSEQIKGDYSARTVQIFGDAGYRLTFAEGTLEPFVGAAYVNLHNDSFTEYGGTSALSGDSGSTSTTYTTLGVRGARDVALGKVQGTVRGTIGWQYAFGDVMPLSTLAFQGGSPFSIAAVPVARNAAVLELGVDAKVDKNTTVGLSLIGQFGDGASTQTIQATLRSRF